MVRHNAINTVSSFYNPVIKIYTETTTMLDFAWVFSLRILIDMRVYDDIHPSIHFGYQLTSEHTCHRVKKQSDTRVKWPLHRRAKSKQASICTYIQSIYWSISNWTTNIFMNEWHLYSRWISWLHLFIISLHCENVCAHFLLTDNCNQSLLVNYLGSTFPLAHTFYIHFNNLLTF